MADHEVRGRTAEVGAQACCPALELVQRLREPPVAGLRELLAVAVPGGEDDVLHSLPDENVLELRLLLDVLLPAPDLHTVERRYRDIDVTPLDELLHLPVEERQDQRPDV